MVCTNGSYKTSSGRADKPCGHFASLDLAGNKLPRIIELYGDITLSSYFILYLLQGPVVLGEEHEI